jgi:hypothetical protein
MNVPDNFGYPIIIENKYNDSNLELFKEFEGLPEGKKKILNPYKKLESYMRNSGSRTRDAKQQKTRDRMKERPIELDWKDLKRIFEKQEQKCFWLGIKINPMDIFDKGNMLAFSVDRIYNHKGYTEENIVITTRLANLGRGSCEFEKFKEYIVKIEKSIIENSLKQKQND